MKTLKKTLCLVLAMVMVFGLCVTSASAKLDAYEDKDDINYAEAVDVMTGIGILAGDARGFRPGDDITRAEAAKIIAYIMIGDSARADALKATSDPFSDVPASHWAAGYISYCATAGIIAGMGDGYHPNDNVTGLQFAKMLLCALGYGVNDEYVGTDWAINTSRDALRLGIFNKNIAGANNNPAIREECALYAFNAMTKVEKVSYSALLGGYITKSITSTDSPDANMKESFQKDFLLEKEDEDTDAFGRDAGHHWILTTNKRPVITANYDDDANLKAVYTTGVTGADIYNLLTSDVTKKSTMLEVYVNGAHEGAGYDDESATVDDDDYDAPSGEIALDNFKKANTDVLAETGNGVRTYVYAKYVEGTLRVKICVIDTYLAKVTQVKEAKGSKDAETTVELLDIGDDAHDTIPELNHKDTFATEEFNEGDYVLVSYSVKDVADPEKPEIKEMSLATVIESTVTRYNNTRDVISVVAGGNTYNVAKNTAEEGTDIYAADDPDKVNSTLVDKEEHVLYLDANNYLIGVGDVKVASNYVYLAQIGTKADTSGKLTDKDVLMGHVYYADGTDEIVVINTKDDYEKGKGPSKVTKTNAFKADDPWGAPAAITKENWDKYNAALNGDADTTDSVLGLYQINMKSGKAILTKWDEAFDDEFVTKGVYPIDGDTHSVTFRMNGKTVYFYISGEYDDEDDPLKVVPYTGVNSIPVAKKGDDPETAAIQGFVAGITAGSAVQALLVLSDIDTDSDDTNVYFFLGTDFGKKTTYAKDEKDATVEYYVYDKDGKETTLTLTYDNLDKADEAIDEADEMGFYTVGKGNVLKLVKGTVAPLYEKDINKTYYVNEATALPDLGDDDSGTKMRGTDQFTLRLKETYTADSAEAEYALYDAKIIDLRDGYDVIANAKSLATLITAAAKDEDDPQEITVAFAYGDNKSQPVSVIFLIPVSD